MNGTNKCEAMFSGFKLSGFNFGRGFVLAIGFGATFRLCHITK